MIYSSNYNTYWDKRVVCYCYLAIRCECSYHLGGYMFKVGAPAEYSCKYKHEVGYSILVLSALVDFDTLFTDCNKKYWILRSKYISCFT